MKVSKSPSLPVLHPDAAGIDIGSRDQYVAVPPDRDPRPVRRFGCTTPVLRELAEWLRACRVTTVALESTGVYWIPVWRILTEAGLEVVVVNPRHVKAVPGRKTDVQDCQWLQQLHTFGLLPASFLPTAEGDTLRILERQRGQVVERLSEAILHMHKALEQMNLQLHKVLTDVTGVSGMAIIRAILGGEHRPERLAALAHDSVHASREEIAAALTGFYRADLLLSLKQAVALYDFCQAQLREVDAALQGALERLAGPLDPTAPGPSSSSARRKNQSYVDLKPLLRQLTGVDLTLLPGVEVLTVLRVVSECGWDMTRFPHEGHFASWLGLSPNLKITGGKVRSSRTRKVKNRAATAFRVAAQTLHKSQSALGAYYRKMRVRLGAPKAITAAAHKLAVLFYRMLRYGEPYVDKGAEAYEAQHRERTLKTLARKAKDLGLTLADATTGEVLA